MQAVDCCILIANIELTFFIDDKNVLNNDALNKTLQIFEKRILDSIGKKGFFVFWCLKCRCLSVVLQLHKSVFYLGGLHHDELKEPLLKKKQRDKLLCDDGKLKFLDYIRIQKARDVPDDFGTLAS